MYFRLPWSRNPRTKWDHQTIPYKLPKVQDKKRMFPNKAVEMGV